MQDVLAKNPNLKGFFFSGGWPMFVPEAYSRAIQSRADDIKSGKFVVISFDVQEPQLRILKSGLAYGAGRSAAVRNGRTIYDRSRPAIKEGESATAR